MVYSCAAFLLLIPPIQSQVHQFPLVSHATHARRLGKPYVASLYEGYGTHYVDLWVGSPKPERQTLIVDTGSSLAAFPCLGCSDCGGEEFHTDKDFNYNLSTTFQRLKCPDECISGHCYSKGGSKECHMGTRYSEGSSWDAFEASDVVFAGGNHGIAESEPADDPSDISFIASAHSFRMSFGCQISLTGLFKEQLADGIIGMSRSKSSFWKQMHVAGQMDKEMFSLCFTRQSHVERNGTLAGAMTLGGMEEKLWKTPLVWAKETSGRGNFHVQIRKMYLQEGGTTLSENISAASEKAPKVIQLDIDKRTVGSALVDSGTTDTYLSTTIAKPFKKIWKQIVGEEYSNREVKMTAEKLLQLPTLLIQLEGVNNDRLDTNTTGLAGELDRDNKYDILVAIPPTHYMDAHDDDASATSRLYLDEHGKSVLGANFMMGHDIVFDVENNRIGFAESDCDYDNLTDAGDEEEEV